MEPLTPEDAGFVSLARESNIILHIFDQVLKFGALTLLPAIAPSPETVYTISFTSGTTFAPKAVFLTHVNAVAPLVFVLSNSISKKNGRYYCFLPLAHIYGKMSLTLSYLLGTAIGLPQSPSPLTLLNDVKELQPHILALVPRVYVKLESAIRAPTISNAEKPLLAKLFNNAIEKLDLMLQYDSADGKHLLSDFLSGLLRKKIA